MIMWLRGSQGEMEKEKSALILFFGLDGGVSDRSWVERTDLDNPDPDP